MLLLFVSITVLWKGKKLVARGLKALEWLVDIEVGGKEVLCEPSSGILLLEDLKRSIGVGGAYEAPNGLYASVGAVSFSLDEGDSVRGITEDRIKDTQLRRF